MTDSDRPAPLGADATVLVAAAVAVQLLFRDRHDLAAHLVAGGGLAVVVAAAAPARTRSSIAALATVAVLVLATIAEFVQPGVVDPGDVAYTGAGALLMARSTTWVVTLDGRRRGQVAALGAAAVLIGLGIRHVG